MEFKTSLTVNCTYFLCNSRFINRSLHFIFSKSHLLDIIWLCLSVGLGIQYLILDKQFCCSVEEIKNQSPDFESKAKLGQFYSSLIALIHRWDSKASEGFLKEEQRIRWLSQLPQPLCSPVGCSSCSNTPGGSLAEGAASWPGSSPQHQQDLAASSPARAAIRDRQMKDGCQRVKLTWLPRWERRQVNWGAPEKNIVSFQGKTGSEFLSLWHAHLEITFVCAQQRTLCSRCHLLLDTAALHTVGGRRDCQEAIHRADQENTEHPALH